MTAVCPAWPACAGSASRGNRSPRRAGAGRRLPRSESRRDHSLSRAAIPHDIPRVARFDGRSGPPDGLPLSTWCVNRRGWERVCRRAGGAVVLTPWDAGVRAPDRCSSTLDRGDLDAGALRARRGAGEVARRQVPCRVERVTRARPPVPSARGALAAVVRPATTRTRSRLTARCRATARPLRGGNQRAAARRYRSGCSRPRRACGAVSPGECESPVHRGRPSVPTPVPATDRG